jgi:ADP-dependent phosphofructokinase/glucokinase
VCFLVNPGNRFVTGTNQRMQKLKASRQMKVFFEEHFYDMDILFMEGCFDLESLYNYQVYENIYNRMKQ